MRLSFIFELLLIFVFLAFAASRVIETKGSHNVRTKTLIRKKHNKLNNKVRQEDNINKYCSCNTKLCNCCREFDIPVVSLKGPGCASLQYLNGDKLAISMSFGDRVLTNTTINSRRPRPICMPLPGGVSKFCGRVYNIARQGQDFNACLGLELKALKDVEAALRVSCFRFGPQGLKVQPSQPLPPVEQDNDDDDDDDDDDDYDEEDEFGFDDDDDDDDDEDEDEDNDVESADYESFSILDDDFIDGLFTSEGDDGESTPIKKVTTTTKAPLRRVTKKPIRRVTQKPINTRKVTKRPSTTVASITNKIAEVTKSTTEAAVLSIITSATVVQSEKKPEFVIPITNVSINEIPDSTSDDMALPEQDSIAIVSTMSDTIPPPQVASTIQPLVNMIPESLNISSEPIKKVEFTEVVTSIANEAMSTTEMYVEQSASTTVSEGTQQLAEDADTTIDEKVATTEAVLADEDEEENDEPIQSFIIKNDDEDEEDEGEEEDSDESDPISEVVEDVLGVEDEKDGKKKSESKVEKVITNKNDAESAESKDVVDDIIDGTVDMISLTDDSEEDAATKNQTGNKEESDEDDFLDDDDEDDDDEDDDDDEEDDAREAKSNYRKRMKEEKRQSRDMWLDRLHW